MNRYDLENLKWGIINQAKDLVGSLDEETEKLANARMDICNSCPNKSDLGLCKLCGCVLSLKTKAPKAFCDDNKW